MNRSTRWFVRASFIWLAAALLLMVVQQLPADAAAGRRWETVSWHLLTVGWITQIIIGVSIWMFPSAKGQLRRKDSPRVWFLFWMLNVGLLLRLLFEPAQPGNLTSAALALSALLQWSAALLYVLEIWPRVRGRRSKSDRG